MKTFLLFTVIFFIISLNFTFAQDFKGNKYISKGKIILPDSVTIECNSITLFSDKVTFTNSETQQNSTLLLKDLVQIEQVTGNQATAWSIGVGIAAALASIPLAITEKNNGFIKTTEINTVTVTLVTSLGSLLGYLIGSSIENTETVYSRDQNSNLSFSAGYNKLIYQPQLTIKLQF
ncbi:MAG: hypothetical protein L6Q66_13790 [Bacteroidia bacterium]|nr:hypothetical protein [Bacteroidia bacterium]